MNNEPMARKLKISILRFNPQERESVPRMVTYEIDEAEGMTLFITDEDFFEVIGDDDGVFGCMSMLGWPRRVSEEPTTGDADRLSQTEDGRTGTQVAVGYARCHEGGTALARTRSTTAVAICLRRVTGASVPSLN